MAKEELSKIPWKQHSHISMEKYYLNTEVAEINGKKIYRHVKTRRTEGGYGLGSSKVTYSETLQSKDLTLNAVRELIEKAYNMINHD